MKKVQHFQVTAAMGLESLVARELKNLGVETVKIDDRSRVFFNGTLEDMMRANLWLRTADRVKLVIGEFSARNFDELFDGVKALPWEEYLPLGTAFPVSKARSVKSDLHNEPAVQAVTKKAIASRLQEIYHRGSDTQLPESGPTFKIEVALHKNVATLVIDTTGSSLFKRGYRLEHGGAPIKENMAAAIILLTSWPANPRRPFVDPTCGSGTFCIEAAMIAQNRAPGLKRSFAYEEWPWVDQRQVKTARDEAQAKIQKDIPLDISGFDIDGKILDIARQNTDAAGLSNVIKYKQMRLQDLRSQILDGVIVSNPPYGERLEDLESVLSLYREMGETFHSLETWSKYILTSEASFESAYGSKATKRRKLYNGKLRVDLYQYFGKRINDGRARSKNQVRK